MKIYLIISFLLYFISATTKSDTKLDKSTRGLYLVLLVIGILLFLVNYNNLHWLC